MNIQKKNIVIIGPPASGKTTFARELYKQNPNHKIIHTDRYIKYGHEGSVGIMVEELQKLTQYWILEGVGGYRFLRKSIGKIKIDIVVEMQITAEQTERIYTEERYPERIKYLKSFMNTHTNILMEYKERMGDREMPEWYKINVHNQTHNK